MPDDAEVRGALRAFLQTLCSVEGLGDDQDIFAGGFVNSLYLVQLLQYVQDRFAITLADDDLDMANFRSIDAMAGFVARKAS